MAGSSSHLCYTPYTPWKSFGFQRRKMSQTQAPTPTFPCSSSTCVNERIWGVFHHQAESHLTPCSQLVPSQLWLETEGMPDLAGAVLEGSVLLQSISHLSNLPGLRLFPSLHSGKIKKDFLSCILPPFGKQSSLWIIWRERDAEGCSEHALPMSTHSAVYLQALAGLCSLPLSLGWQAPEEALLP